MENKFKEFWIFKGTSNFCSELVMNDEYAFAKDKPDGFYDIVATKDTVEGGIHMVDYAALESANAEFKLLKTYYDDLYAQAKGDELGKLQHELAYHKELEARYNQLLEETSAKELVRLQTELNICDQAIESLSNDRTEAYEIIDKLEAALNKIGMLAMSEYAYTSEFTTKVVGIVREVLK